MKDTMKSFISETRVPAPLIRAVVKQSGGWDNFREIAEDVANYGADAGFPGWIYHDETKEFFQKNREAILECAEALAEDLGVDLLSMIRGFGMFRNDPINNSDLAKALYAGKGEDASRVYDVMSWFALEEVASAYVDLNNFPLPPCLLAQVGRQG